MIDCDFPMVGKTGPGFPIKHGQHHRHRCSFKYFHPLSSEVHKLYVLMLNFNDNTALFCNIQSQAE